MKFPKPWYRPARGVWYVTLDGKQINLGADKDQAFQEYARLLAEPKVREVPSGSLLAIIDSFLEWVQKHRAQETYGWYQYRLERFAKRYPDMRASELRPFHVQEWVDGYRLSVTSKRNYLRAVKRCLSWAAKQGYLDRNPIAALEVPAGEAKEITLSSQEFEALLAEVKDEAFRDLLIVTWETACRPQESLRVEARHVDLANQRWVFPKSESKKKKRSRVVYLSDSAAEITRQLVQRYPNGKLFRNKHGQPWTTDAVNCAFLRVRIRKGMKTLKEKGLTVSQAEIDRLMPTLKTMRKVKNKTVTKSEKELRQEAKRKVTYRLARSLAPSLSLYALRHAWATNALQKGIDPLTTAILMGHSDPGTLAKVYQHLSLDPKHMLDAAKRAIE